MIEAIAARRFRLAGHLYETGAALTLPDNQFNDLASCGLVERAPAAPVAPKVALPATKARR